MANIIKYRSINLIIFYYHIYFGLSGTTEVVIQNFIGLMRNTVFDSWIDVWLEWSVICTKEDRKSIDIRSNI